MAAQNFVIGNKTKIFFSILPESLLAAPIAPSDVNIVVDVPGTGSNLAVGAKVLPVTALTNPVPTGTPIVLKDGTGVDAPTFLVYTTASAKKGATEIAIEATTVGIPDGATGTYTAMLLLEGGTTSDEQIQAQDTESMVYNDELGYSTGQVTKATWMISYSFNVLPSDIGYARLSYAAIHAARGIRGWVRKEDPAPAGYTKGEVIEGLCDVTDFSKSNPSDGIITGKCTFKGRGAPSQKHYV